jgi:copper(I)-binding protein
VSAALVFGAGSLLAACGDDDGDDATSTTADASATTEAPDTSEAPAGDELVIEGAWARTSPAMTSAGAVYFQITNPTDADDALVDVSVDASIAGTAELHETSMASGDGMSGDDMGGDDMGEEGGAMGGDDMATTTAMGGDDMSGDDMGGDDMDGGMMTMQEVDEIPVPAGETVSLEPGGYHVMLLDLVAPLEAGDTIEVTLTFAEAGEVVVEAEVRDTAP